MIETNSIDDYAAKLGIETVAHFDASLLFPEDRIRAFCVENRCGQFGANHMCPPQTGSVEQIKAFLKKFRNGILLQYSSSIDVKNDKKGLKKTKLDFHRKIIKIENYLKQKGETEIMGMIGGNCELCSICKAALGEACIHPGRARTSLEAMAIDVMALRQRFGLDTGFYSDKITWTGCILTE